MRLRNTASGFQSTLPRGSDSSGIDSCTMRTLFQSTLPRGSDAAAFRAALRRMDFNPRSLAGATFKRRCRLGGGHISIHAPSRERRSAGSSCGSSSLFQSTLPRGSDVTARSFRSTGDLYFNPRSLAGATRLWR